MGRGGVRGGVDLHEDDCAIVQHVGHKLLAPQQPAAVDDALCRSADAQLLLHCLRGALGWGRGWMLAAR